MRALAILKKNIDFLLIILTLIGSACLVLAYLSAFINPNKFWYFSFFGLAAPFFVIANLFMLFFWMIRWKFWAFIPLGVLLIGTGLISPMFQFPIGKKYNSIEDKNTIKFMSYNVHMFVHQNWQKSTVHDILHYVNDEKPDIVCFQEFNETPGFPVDSVRAVLKDLPYFKTAFKYQTRTHSMGLAVFSRYKIVDITYLRYDNSANMSMWVDVMIGSDTVRIFNNHLQTTNINAKDKEFLQSENLLNNGNIENGVKSIARKLRNNYRLRAFQADTISNIIKETPYPVIICGDFNDTPMSYTYRKVRGNLKDAFVQGGRGYAYTYRGFLNLLRIDYVFHTRDFKSVYYESPSVPWSDHNPVIVYLKRE